jgi:cell division protein YceG involved in septum cleavage
MKGLIFALVVIISINAIAQNNTAANIIEGGKTLVELVRVFKMPRYTMSLQPVVEKKDSCAIKNVTDFTIKNSTEEPLLVSLYRRNGNVYEAGVLSLKILPKNQETIYEIKAGIYNMKFETEADDEKKMIRQGEIKLIGCQHIFKEIKKDGS